MYIIVTYVIIMFNTYVLTPTYIYTLPMDISPLKNP